jgi:hypothetical protein
MVNRPPDARVYIPRWRNRNFEMLSRRGIFFPTGKSSMNTVKMNSLKRDVLEIAMELKNDPKKTRVFANKLRLRICKAAFSKEVSDHHWEWYAILTLWPPLEVIKLLEDSIKSATGLRRAVPLLALLSEEEEVTSSF